jgi:hypothetical protein
MRSDHGHLTAYQIGCEVGQSVAPWCLDQNRDRDGWTCTWLALLFNRQQHQHVDLHAYCPRRAPLGRQDAVARRRQNVFRRGSEEHVGANAAVQMDVGRFLSSIFELSAIPHLDHGLERYLRAGRAEQPGCVRTMSSAPTSRQATLLRLLKPLLAHNGALRQRSFRSEADID